MKKVLLSFVALGTLAFAAGDTFKVNLLQDSTIEGKNLKAGEYKVSIGNGNAIFKQGKEMIEVPAHEVSQTDRVSSTVLQYQNGSDLQEIRVGGTHTRIVFNGSTSMHSGM